jgi:ankyrin repeat protein
MSSVDLAKMKQLYNYDHMPGYIEEALNSPEVDVNWQNNDDGNKTLLIKVIDDDGSGEHEKLPIVELLLANGANINAKDENGMTAFDYAQKNNYTTIVEYLKNPDSKTMKTKPSVDLKTMMKNLYDNIFQEDYKTKAALNRPGVDVNWQNEADGNKTLLIQAIASNASDEDDKRDIVKMLLDKGADIEVRDTSGKRALDYSISKNYHTITRLLWDHQGYSGGRKSKRSKRSRKSKRSKRSRKSRRNRRTKRR